MRTCSHLSSGNCSAMYCSQLQSRGSLKAALVRVVDTMLPDASNNCRDRRHTREGKQHSRNTIHLMCKVGNLCCKRCEGLHVPASMRVRQPLLVSSDIQAGSSQILGTLQYSLSCPSPPPSR